MDVSQGEARGEQGGNALALRGYERKKRAMVSVKQCQSAGNGGGPSKAEGYPQV